MASISLIVWLLKAISWPDCWNGFHRKSWQINIFTITPPPEFKKWWKTDIKSTLFCFHTANVLLHHRISSTIISISSVTRSSRHAALYLFQIMFKLALESDARHSYGLCSRQKWTFCSCTETQASAYTVPLSISSQGNFHDAWHILISVLHQPYCPN